MESEDLNSANNSSIELEELEDTHIDDTHNQQMDNNSIELEELGNIQDVPNLQQMDNIPIELEEIGDTRSRKLVYRKLLDELDVIEESEELGMKTAKHIGKIIKTANMIETQHNIKTRYQYPDEILLDSKVLSLASGVLVKCIDALDASVVPYDASEFAQNIIKLCKLEGDFDVADLLNLMSDAQEIIPEVPAYNSLYGSYDLMNLPKPKQKNPKQKRQKDNVVEKKAPEKVKTVDKEEQGIDEILTLLYDVLKQHYKRNNNQPIRYYDYVIDTSDFATTVENMFYFSFLIRDGRASITLDGENQPRIKPMSRRELDEHRQNGGGNEQMITAITISEWQKFKKEGYIQQYKKLI